jgi:hypothetical protein
MQKSELTDQQTKEILDNIGNMLTTEIDSAPIQNKIQNTISNYLKTNNINKDAKALAEKIQISVKTSLPNKHLTSS